MVSPVEAGDGTANAEVAMRTGIMLLAPLLVLIAGCSEETEGQETMSEPSEIEVPPEPTGTAVEASRDPQADLKLRSPVGLD